MSHCFSIWKSCNLEQTKDGSCVSNGNSSLPLSHLFASVRWMFALLVNGM